MATFLCLIMKLQQLVIICSFGLCFVATTASAQDCSHEMLDFCMSIFTKQGFDVLQLTDDLPQWIETDAILKNRCQTFDIYSTCMSSVTSYCNADLQLTLQGLNDAYSYLCTNSSLIDVAEYLQCYRTPNVVIAAKICNDTYYSKVQTIKNVSNSVVLGNDYCQIADTFFDCITSILSDNCGSNASQWQKTWNRYLNMPTFQAIGCPGWISSTTASSSSPADNTWTVAIAVILSLITFVLIVSIAVLLVFLVKKRKQRTMLRDIRHRVHGANAPIPPPPYSAVVFTTQENGGEPQPCLVYSSIVVPPGELGAIGGSRTVPTTEPILPPPYMGRQPVPEYKATTKDKEKEASGEQQ